MKLADFTMKQINVALDGQPERLGEWKGGSRSCLIGTGESGGKTYQVKIHASEPKWNNVDDEIRRKKEEIRTLSEDAARGEKERLESELNTLKRAKPDRDRRDAISDQFLDMRQKLVRSLNSIGSPLIGANADIWKEPIPFRGNATFAVEATPWIEYFVGFTAEEGKPMIFGELSTDQQYKIVASLADVLSKVHAKGIIHGDLKIGNTLITKEDGELKVALIDYDASFILDDLRRRKYEFGAWRYVIGGTYIAPELFSLVEIMQADYKEGFDDFDLNTVTEKSDIFSLGVTIYEYFYGRADGPNFMPFFSPDGEAIDVRDYGASLNYGYKLNLPDTVPDFLYGMLNWMLAANPSDRPTAVQVRDAFVSADVNMIPSQYTRCPLWDEHRDKYELTLPAGYSISKASKPMYKLHRPGSTSTRKIEELVKEGYAIDKTGVLGPGGSTPPDPTLVTKLWQQDGEGKLPICVRRATIAGKYQMSIKGVTRFFTYEQLCAAGVICSEEDMRMPWPCDAGLRFYKSGIMRDVGLGKGPGHYKIGEGLATIRRTTKELINAGDASYGVEIKLHPKDAEMYSANPSAVPTNISNIFPDPLKVHRYVVVVTGGAMSKMMIDELEAKGYVRVK